MAKQKEETPVTTEIYKIKRAENYKGHFIILPLEKSLVDKFNKGETIEVSEKELNEIGTHRWLVSEVN